VTGGSALPVLLGERRFAARPAQVGAARRFLATLLPRVPVAAEAVLCLSELASNAISHSRSGNPGGWFTVRASHAGGLIRVEVEDQGGPWAPGGNGDAEGGRGLLIVAELATAWGRSGSSEAGWTVWFTVDCP
jgi:serine/threonine-protein kinase RsbW